MVFVKNNFIRFAFTLSASRFFVNKKWCWFSKINVFHQFLPHGSHILFFFSIMMSSTYTDKNNPCFRWTKRPSQFGTFSHPNPSRVSSNCPSHNNPADGHWIFNVCPWFWSLVSWKTYPYLWTFILTLEFWAIWERFFVLPKCTRILHQLLVRRKLVILQ